ncbi:MAG TPA: thiamine phosphate synthase [Verrucomicrobiales bacterium]|nr:thiamine phosphate synthase [Verrucomicrobiales bacterium]
MKSISDCRLYGILDTGYCAPAAMPAMLSAMLRGGIDIVQLRAKDLSPDRILELARELHPLSLAAGVPFIINDHPSLAAEAGVEGVHVGQDDLSVSEARRVAGEGRIVGLSTHSLAQVQGALESRPDYIGFGPLFSTATKPDYTPIGMADIAAAHRLASFPIFCIGGIKRENLPAVITAGARRAVIVSGILNDAEPERYIRDCTGMLTATA